MFYKSIKGKWQWLNGNKQAKAQSKIANMQVKVFGGTALVLN